MPTTSSGPPDIRLAIEYDGLAHLATLDRRRDARTGRLGWQTIRLTVADLADPVRSAAALRAVHQQRTTLLRGR